MEWCARRDLNPPTLGSEVVKVPIETESDAE